MLWRIGAENTIHLLGNFLHLAESFGPAPPNLLVTARSWNRRQDGPASQQASTSKVAIETRQDGLALETHGVLASSGPATTVELSSPVTPVELSGVTTAELPGVTPVAMSCCPMTLAESSGPTQPCLVGLPSWHRRPDGLAVAGWRQVAGHWKNVAEHMHMHMAEPL